MEIEIVYCAMLKVICMFLAILCTMNVVHPMQRPSLVLSACQRLFLIDHHGHTICVLFYQLERSLYGAGIVSVRHYKSVLIPREHFLNSAVLETDFPM